MLHLRKRPILFLCGLPLLLAGINCWYEMPERKVPRFLRELRDTSHGGLDQLYLGRSAEVIHADLDRLGRDSIPALIKALNDSDEFVRYLAADQLGKLRDSRAVKPLICC